MSILFTPVFERDGNRFVVMARTYCFPSADQVTAYILGPAYKALCELNNWKYVETMEIDVTKEINGIKLPIGINGENSILVISGPVFTLGMKQRVKHQLRTAYKIVQENKKEKADGGKS